MSRFISSQFLQQTYTKAPVEDLSVAIGRVPGFRSVDKFGRNTDIDSGITADVWDGGHTVGANPAGTSLIWVAPTAARLHTIASTDAGDTSGGAGARTLRIFGLPGWGAKEVSEDITMNTGSPPSTANSYVIIHRMQVLTKGATSSNIGIITATTEGQGGSNTITARINADAGQTQMAIYGIPSSQTMYLDQIYASMDRNSGGAATGYVDVSLEVNPEPTDELLNFLIKHTFGLSLNGTSMHAHNYTVPKIVPGPAIIKMQVVSSTANMDISAGFDGTLVDNDKA